MNSPLAKSRRARKTRPSVKLAERLSYLFISVSGIGTILAVSLIFVFLLYVVLPLFRSATFDGEVRVPSSSDRESRARSEVAQVMADEYGLMLALLERDGTLLVRSLSSGEILDEQKLFASAPSAISLHADSNTLAFGFADGTLRLATLDFTARFPRSEDLEPEAQDVQSGAPIPYERGMLLRTPEGELRLSKLEFELGDPIALATPRPIARLTHVSNEDGAVLVFAADDGTLHHVAAVESENMFTGEVSFDVVETPLTDIGAPGRALPERLLLTGLADGALLLWEDGHYVRLDVRRPSASAVMEVGDVLPADGQRVTAARFMIGGSTLVVGDSEGGINAWFRAKPARAGTPDGTLLVRAHELPSGRAPVRSLAPSPRSRLLAAGFENGDVWLYQVTTEELLARVHVQDTSAVHALEIGPKEDAVVALSAAGLTRWSIDPRHPEASLTALFRPVWYEGYEGPTHAWQSESATDDFEPKLGFWPLVFGTLKATFYSMAFGTPLALLAAIFTSEFLDRRLRVPIKSTIEMMASLPSVVLGFLAALVIAPFAQKIIPATLALFLTIPFALVLGAQLWRLLPQALTLRFSGWQRLVSIAVMLPVGILGALALGPAMERLLFAGDMELWLDGQRGSGVGGSVLLLLPVAVLAAIFLTGRTFGGWMRRAGARWTRRRSAAMAIVQFGLGALLTIALALGAAFALDGVGFDPRGSFFGTYVQRNALIVGFVMGFAIIPIIYTLAEDALSSVPEHLRLASLGAGATPWQTAVRVIIPTAMSGLFSAMMIGLGRAVGETMIVLMATGNTPVMELNVFNGLRTLSANIAVELPEAVQNSTHYRTLFLAALVLFAMTFALNTAAEIVRLRFRKRSYQL